MSLTVAYDDGNVFAKILRGEMPCVKVYEDEIALAFMDIFPQSRGHLLVIPKGVKARNFLDLPTDMVGPYLARVQRLAQAAAKALSPDGVVVMQFNGAPAGQTVFHLHFHIIPRWEGETLKGHGAAPKGDIGELQTLAEAIAAAL